MNTMDRNSNLPMKDTQFAYSRRAPGQEADTVADMPGLSGPMLWVVLALIYFVLPDFIPGPIDDFIVNAAALANLFYAYMMRQKNAGAAK